MRILLVEKDVATQKTAVHLLEKSGCEVDAVANGREAIEVLEMAHYHLVFMDADTPETDGYEVTKLIRDPYSGVRRHDVPVIAMTAAASKEDRKRCIEAGMEDCIFKPIQPQRLLEIVNAFLPASPPGSKIN